MKIVTLARMSTPGSNVDFFCPCLSMPRSPVRTPATRASCSAPVAASKSTSVAGKPVKMSIPSASTRPPSHFTRAAEPLHEAVERDDVVAVVLEERRRDRQAELAGARQEVDVVALDFGGQRRALGLEVRNQLGERRGI